MKIILIIVVASLLACTFTLVEMMIQEKISQIRKKKKLKAIESLNQGDEIEIIHPGYDSKAVFLALITEDIHIVVFKNNIQNMATILPYSNFVKKL